MNGWHGYKDTIQPVLFSPGEQASEGRLDSPTEGGQAGLSTVKTTVLHKAGCNHYVHGPNLFPWLPNGERPRGHPPPTVH